MVRKVRLPDLDPVTREQVAEWIEYQGAALAKRTNEAENLLAQGMGSANLVGQATYWRNAQSFSQRLAWLVRTAVTKKLRSPSEPPPKA